MKWMPQVSSTKILLMNFQWHLTLTPEEAQGVADILTPVAWIAGKDGNDADATSLSWHHAQISPLLATSDTDKNNAMRNLSRTDADTESQTKLYCPSQATNRYAQSIMPMAGPRRRQLFPERKISLAGCLNIRSIDWYASGWLKTWGLAEGGQDHKIFEDNWLDST